MNELSVFVVLGLIAGLAFWLPGLPRRFRSAHQRRARRAPLPIIFGPFQDY